MITIFKANPLCEALFLRNKHSLSFYTADEHISPRTERSYFLIWLFQSEYMMQKKKEYGGLVAYRKYKTNKKRDNKKGGEAAEEEIQDINTYTNTNLIPPRRFRSARYPITHKALITQLISIYLITPSLPGTISTGPGRESPSACSPPISLAPRSFFRLFLSLLFRSFSQIVDTPLLFAFLQNANRSRGYAPRVHRGLHDST